MTKEIAPGVAVDAIPFPEPEEFDFNNISPGESFVVRAGGGRTARQTRDHILGRANHWLRNTETDAHFRSEKQADDSYRIYMIAGKRVYPSKQEKGIL